MSQSITLKARGGGGGVCPCNLYKRTERMKILKKKKKIIPEEGGKQREKKGIEAKEEYRAVEENKAGC